MSARKTCINATVIVALFVSAFGAASASALSTTVHKCGEATGTSGFTYTTNSCTTAGEAGSFHKIPFTSEEVEIANPSNVQIIMPTGGVNAKVVCTGTSAKTTATDTGESITSAGKFTFSGCTVTEPAGRGCVVKGGGGATGVIISKELSSTIKRTGEGTYKQLLIPRSGTLLFELEISACSTTALNGTRSFAGTLSASVAGNMKSEFTNTSGSELKFGGNSASFLGSWEYKTTSTGGLISFGA